MKKRFSVDKIKPQANQMMQEVIGQYWQSRPFFYSFIRPQEAYLFYHYQQFIQDPLLDFGHGDGFFASLLSNWIKTKIEVGLDLTESRIDQAQQYHLCHRLIKYDGKKINVPDKTFKSVISNCVFEHLDDLNFSLSELRRVLKPTGYLLTTVMTNVWEDTLLGNGVIGQRYQKMMRKQQIHYNLLSADEWHARFEQAGFRVLAVNGYLPVWMAHWLELSHYVSIAGLLSFKLAGRWTVPVAWLRRLALDQWLARLTKKSLFCQPEESAALFYLVQRN